MRARGFLWLVTVTSLTSASWATRLAKVNNCLKNSSVPQVAPDSDLFADSIEPYNLRLPFTPVALAVPATIPQVQAAVSCAASSNVTVSAKGGGHSYASHGLGGEDGHLVIDVQKFNTTSVDADSGVAKVGTGSRTGRVAIALFEDGKRAISHGTCPSVGISGLTLHGGYGLSARTHGLALDNLVEIEVVLANSTVVNCSKSENEDLFWAMRGAGSSFGIATSLSFQTFPAPEKNVVFGYNIDSENRTQAVNALTVLQNFVVEDQPAELNMRSFLRGGSISLEGVYYGNQSDFDSVMKPLLKNLGILRGNETSDEDDREVVGWMEALEAYAYGPMTAEPSPETFFAKSLMTPELSADAITALVDYLFDTAVDVRRGWYLLLDYHGGKSSAITQVPVDETSYAHRGAIMKMQFFDSAFISDYPEDGFDFLNGWVDAIQTAQGEGQLGMYINYADSSLTAEEAHQAYWMGNYERLSQLKEKYDPKKLIMNPQAINS